MSIEVAEVEIPHAAVAALWLVGVVIVICRRLMS